MENKADCRMAFWMPGQGVMDLRLEAAIQVGPCGITLRGCAAHCKNSLVEFGKLDFLYCRCCSRQGPLTSCSRFEMFQNLDWLFLPVNKNLLQDLRAITDFQLPMGFPYRPCSQGDALKLVMLLVMLLVMRLRQVQIIWRWLKWREHRSSKAAKQHTKQAAKATSLEAPPVFAGKHS